MLTGTQFGSRKLCLHGWSVYIEGQALISILTKKLGLLGSIFLDILIVSPVDFEAIIHKLIMHQTPSTFWNSARIIHHIDGNHYVHNKMINEIWGANSYLFKVPFWSDSTQNLETICIYLFYEFSWKSFYFHKPTFSFP